MRERPTRDEQRRARIDDRKAADAAGLIADGMEYRLALVKRVKAGEITLEQAQAELRSVQRGARKAGKRTFYGSLR